eukprot:scaffold7722_cov228-Alexandrium_tamarense.AAC.3
MAPPRSKQRRQQPPHSLVLSLSIIITCCLLSESSAFCLPSGHDAPSPSLSSFTFALGRQQQSTSSLSYASAATAAESGPMSKVDSSKSGGCPFLVTSFDHRVYTVNALFSEADSRPIILFDGECNLCNSFVQTLLKYDSCSDDVRGNLRFAALQSKVGELLLRRMSDELRSEVVADTDVAADSTNGANGIINAKEEKYKSIVVCTPSQTFIQSSAVLQILQSLGSSPNGGKSSKRLKALQYLSLLGCTLPTKLRDGVYKIISKRRKKWFGSSDECLIWDEKFETRFVDDGVLTGVFRDPFADPSVEIEVMSVNVFEGENPPKRGDKVRIVWPADSTLDPSVSYDDEFPNGICLIGGSGTISTVDLPMRVVMRVDRESVGLGPDASGEKTMIAWAKPSEIALLD